VILQGDDYGHCLCATGARGWWGEGYWWHRYWRRLGLDWAGSTLVAKTTTLLPRKGNMPLGPDLGPAERVPDCVRVKWWAGAALNSVGLSGPGAETLLRAGRWQAREEPTVLSFMSVEGTRAKRSYELIRFLRLLEGYLPDFEGPVALQLNLSCPNAGREQAKTVGEPVAWLVEASALGVPLIPKLSVLFPPEDAVGLQDHCDALCVSNTVPYGALPDLVDWEGLFGRVEAPEGGFELAPSPLAHLGGGGLSGAPLLPLVVDWVRRARAAGFEKPIDAGGGVLGPRDVDALVEAGATSVFVGSAAFLRPWKVASIVRRVNLLLGGAR